MKKIYKKTKKIAEEIGLDYSSIIPLEYFNDDSFNAYLIGYNDAINSRLDMHNYNQIDNITYIEDFFYIHGYLDAIREYDSKSVDSTIKYLKDDHKKIVIKNMTTVEFGDMLASIEFSLDNALV